MDHRDAYIYKNQFSTVFGIRRKLHQGYPYRFWHGKKGGKTPAFNLFVILAFSHAGTVEENFRGMNERLKDWFNIRLLWYGAKKWVCLDLALAEPFWPTLFWLDSSFPNRYGLFLGLTLCDLTLHDLTDLTLLALKSTVLKEIFGLFWLTQHSWCPTKARRNVCINLNDRKLWSAC